MPGDFKGRSDDEHAKMCVGLIYNGEDCSRGSAVQNADLVGVSGCVVDSGISERRSGTQIEIVASMEARWCGDDVSAVEGAAAPVGGV